MTEQDAATEVAAFLAAQGLLVEGESAEIVPLTGGVSSEIWRVDLPGSTVCVKRALARLKVEREWLAPVSRNRVEREYLAWGAEVAPGQVPRVLAHDDTAGIFAMEYLSPEQHPVWKAGLLAGHVDAATAAGVGALLGRLHSASAEDAALRTRFATDDNFDALRIDPYLRVTARAHPDLADRFAELATRTANTHRVVVHGDVSPKNILLGAVGPILLDAECAWFGDPAFDVAFCVNHLLIKSVALPDQADALLTAAHAFLATYAEAVDWEPEVEIAERTGTLLPALTLARVDGSSPVEYLTDAQRDTVRTIGRTLLKDPATTFDAIPTAWAAV